MKLADLFKMTTLALAVVASPIVAADTMSAAQKKDIEQVVHDYLVNNPEVLIEVSQVLQKKQQQDMQQQAKSAISQNMKLLLADTLAVAGNPKGNVTLIEFFDYQCIHCKKMKPVINELIGKNTNLRVIYKEFPIFGEGSEVASRAALAAAMQGKYAQMQEALMKSDKRMNKEVVMAIAKSVGLDMKKLNTDMNSDTVSKELANNRVLAEKMHLMGTPAVVVVATQDGQAKSNKEPVFVPGAASEATLENLIKEAGKA